MDLAIFNQSPTASLFKLCYVIIIIFSHRLTYMTFRYEKNIEENSVSAAKQQKINVSLMYIVVYIYNLLYIMLLLHIVNWFGQLYNLIMKSTDTTFEKNIGEIMQQSFSNAYYTLPIYVLLSMMSYGFDINLLFNSDNTYSAAFQTFSLVTTLIFVLVFKHKPELDNKTLMTYFVFAITLFSLAKNTVPSANGKSSSGIDSFINGFVNLFLHFNWTLLYISIPFIVVFMGGVSLMVDPTLVMIYSSIIIVSIICFTLVYKLMKKGLDFEPPPKLKKLIEIVSLIINPPVIKHLVSWMLSLLIYTVPLLVITFLKDTSGIDTMLFVKTMMEVFNITFAKSLGVIYLFMIPLQSTFKIDANIIKNIVNLLIISGLIVSRDRKSLLSVL